jgi:hypothetical protein
MMFYVKQEKSKPKLKPKKEREEYAAWLASHQTPVAKKQTRKLKPWTYGFSEPVRGTQNIPSLNPSMMGNAPLPEQKVYTGDKIIGITIIHKSCLQPVFNQQQAIDAANMRR